MKNRKQAEDLTTQIEVEDWFWTKAEVAHYCQITIRCVDKWMKRGFLPYYKIGRSVRFQAADVRAFLKRNFRVGGA